MTPRAATIYQLWCGEKIMAGDKLTEDELAVMIDARAVTLNIAHRIMRVKPEDYDYTPGQSFK